MKYLRLVIDLLLDAQDLLRLQNSPPGYIYGSQSQSLYLKHLNHLAYHAPYLVVSYGRDQHEIIHLPTRQHQPFLMTHQELEAFHSVAVGVTQNQALLALGDSHFTRLQVVDVSQPLRVHLNTTYMEPDSPFFPVPRYFSISDSRAELVYHDSSRLALDLSDYSIGRRQPAAVDQIVAGQTVADPQLSILGPFVILTIPSSMTLEQLQPYRPLIKAAQESAWISLDATSLLHTGLVDIHDFDELIEQRSQQVAKLLSLLDPPAD